MEISEAELEAAIADTTGMPEQEREACSTSSRKGSQWIVACAETANGNAFRLVRGESAGYVSIGFFFLRGSRHCVNR
jgi:hypothetical protein